ncbi:MAG: hypothetical protein IPM95_13910, partial [Sphingobacteriales bacterium]|nr:hypothetical protein [Sphingobacteriales bacterium]
TITTLLPSDAVTVNATSCNPADTGTVVTTLTNQYGCDSVVTTITTLLPKSLFTQNIALCTGQSISVGNNTYTAPGIYTDTLIAINGCDSIITTNITAANCYLPLADADSTIVPEDESVIMPVLVNDTFGDDGPNTGTIAITQQPTNGIATVNDGGTPNDPSDDQIVFIPNINYNGLDSIIYQICDSNEIVIQQLLGYKYYF